MIHFIKIEIPENIDYESLFKTIEKVFNQENFIIGRENEILIFEKKTSVKGDKKFQILIELSKGLTQGTIYVDSLSRKELICKINYSKQGVISLVLGLLISAIFSLYTEHFLTPFLRLGLPFAIAFLIVGIMKGNSQVKELLKKAIEQEAHYSGYMQ